MKKIMWKVILGFTAVLLGMAPLMGQFVLSQEVVDGEVKNIVAQLKKMQSWDGSFNYGTQYKVGTTALVIYAMASAGYDETDKTVADGVAYLQKNQSKSTYEEGLVICALQRLAGDKYKARIRKAYQYLLATQVPIGGWGYGDNIKLQPDYADESCSQYAILGLAAAKDIGLALPQRTVTEALGFYGKRQNADGGWPYVQGNSTFSMTSAGLASLRLLGETLELPVPGRCGSYRMNPKMQQAYKWLTRNTRGFLNSFHQRGMNGYYALYAFERVCILNGLKEMGGMDWYREGCVNIIRNGNWRTDIISTCFVLLFIARNSAPYAVTKWKWNGRWNPDKYDAANWTKHVSELLKKPLDYQIAELGTPDGNPGLSSMIYVTGHGRFTATERELAELKKYIGDGGIVVAEACCSDKTFYNSFASVMEKELDPGNPRKFVSLHPAHPLFSSYYRLSPDQLKVKALKRGCGASQVFLLSQEISCALNGDQADPVKRREAFQAAANLMVYALNKRKPKAKFEKINYSALGVDALLNRQVKAGSGAVYQYQAPLGRVRHGGTWDTDPGFSKRLMQTFSDNPDLPVFDAELPVDPESDDIFACPVLLMTGHGSPSLSPKAVSNLKRYLANGGRIIIEACCADVIFNDAIQNLLPVLDNGRKPQIVRADDPIYHTPYPLTPSTLETTQAWKMNFGSAMPAIYGIRGADGAWNLIYFPYDVSCALDGDLEENIPALKEKSAAKLLANVIAALMTPPETEVRQ